MNTAAVGSEPLVLARLRSATGEAHGRLDQRLDVVRRLAEPTLREAMLRRYAAFHLPADAMFASRMGHLAELEMGRRRRAALLGKFAVEDLPTFPQPKNEGEALGMLYVTEGSTLGGRLILRELTQRGVSNPDLAFLDPYGRETGAMWRGMIGVLDRQIGRDEERLRDCCAGAVAAFSHAERVLCDGVGV